MMNSPRFSILIPLEFHRGVGARCIEGWADYRRRRGDFEVILAAPSSLPRREMEMFKPHLSVEDRLLVFDVEHDMTLVAEAALAARGEWLIFTESHVFPKPNLLERLDEVIAANSSWGALSCFSEPLVHNRLSRIEAGIYDEHIRSNLRNHPWLKVLDQCFVIRREVYEKSGGIEPEFGHFAEWLFAARLALAGVEVGFDDRPGVEHYYIGELADLEEFTKDFARGECRFFLKHGSDPARRLFPPFRMPAEGDHRGLKQVWRKWRSLTRFAMAGGVPVEERLRAVGAMVDAALRACPGHGWEALCIQAGIMMARWRVRGALLFGQEADAKKQFLTFLGRCVEAGRKKEARQAGSGAAFHPCWFEWKVSSTAPGGWWGFSDLEYTKKDAFSWMNHSGGLTFFDLGHGGCVSFELAAGLPPPKRIFFDLDGEAASSEFLETPSTRMIRVKIPPSKRGKRRLGWKAVPLTFKGDWRRPCAAVKVVRIEQSWDAIANGRSRERKDWCQLVRRVEEPVAFFHIPKSAGTSMRLVLSNAWSAEENADPFLINYQNPVPPVEPYPKSWRFIASHRIGFDTLSAETLVVVTLLRDPVARLISHFNYLRGLKLIPAATTIREYANRVHSGETSRSPNSFFRSGASGRTPEILQREVLDNLARCAVVGIVEEMDSVIDLACWRLGIYPPKASPHANKTASLTAANCHPDEEDMALLKKLTALDQALYEGAKVLFDRQRTEMMEELGLSRPEEAREQLRERFFTRIAQQSSADLFEWDPRDPLIGEGLYDLECHDGQFLRWSYGDGALLYFPEPAGSGRHVAEILVHRAGRKVLEAVEIRINGLAASVQHHSAGADTMIVAREQNNIQRGHPGVVSIEIRCPQQSEVDDIRPLGLPLLGARLYKKMFHGVKASFS